MGLLALLLIGLAGWLIWTGRLQRMSVKDGMALGMALVGAVTAAKGKPGVGGAMMIATTLFFLLQQHKAKPGRAKVPPRPRDDDIAKARALLGVRPTCDAAEIRAAHRRLIASVHPDRGGTEALAAQINAARDLLLAEQVERESSPKS